jgi:hypothetical protein
MKPRATPVLVALILASLTSAAASQTRAIVLTPTSPIDSVAMAFEGASFVFTGRVRLIGATTTRSVSTTHAIVVRIQQGVDTAFVAPGGMRPLIGRELTVVVDSLNWFSAGATVLVFARGLAADEGIAVREIGHMSTTGMTSKAIADVVARALDNRMQKAVSALYDRSALVVVGTVDSVLPVTEPAASGRRERGEHKERQALVRVQRTFKGDSRASPATIRVLFDPMMVGVDFLGPGRAYLLGLRSTDALTPTAVRGVDGSKRYRLVDPEDIRVVADTIRLPRARR